jgi:hypothetical protein
VSRTKAKHLQQEQFPFRDFVGVAEERRHRQFLRRARFAAGQLARALDLATGEKPAKLFAT